MRPWNRIRSFAYQLQGASPAQLRDSGFDLAVIDYARDGSEAGRYTATEVASIRRAPGGPKRVIAYLSIGEAEDYRYYWMPAWKQHPPPWLGPVNPEWRGNYLVRYWDPRWRGILFGSPQAYLDKIIDAGFDGVYLDVVDAYERWEDQRPSARAEMRGLVEAIAHYARVQRGRPDFGIFAQNGDDLLTDPAYRGVLTGQAREDLHYGYEGDGRPTPASTTRAFERNLDLARSAGILVLTVDYTRDPRQIDDAYRRSEARGYVPYVTVRALDRLIVNPGHRPVPTPLP